MIIVQHQTEVHYAMPVRDLTEHAIAYEMQLAQLRSTHKDASGKKIGLSGPGEFLSGIKMGEKLKPNISFVLYGGLTPYNGPRDLADLYDVSGIPSWFGEQWLNKWPIHVVEVHDPDNEVLFQSVAAYASNCKKDTYLRGIADVAQICKNHAGDKELMDTIETVLGVKRLRKVILRELGGAQLQAESVTWLDGAFNEGEEVGEKRGVAKGIIATARVFGAADDFIVQSLMESLGYTESEAENALKVYGAEADTLKKTT